MPKHSKKKIIEIHINENLPTLLVDNLNINTRRDGMFFLRFLTALPEGLKEQARMMILEKDLKRMLDVMCSHSGYYPTRKKGKKAPSPQK